MSLFINSVIYDDGDWIAQKIEDINKQASMLALYQICTGEFHIAKGLEVNAIAPFSPGKILVYHDGGIKSFSLDNEVLGLCR